MSTEALVSPLYFDSYKIDNLSLRMKPHLELLKIKGHIDQSLWTYNIDLRPPVFFKAAGEYVGGIQFSMALFPADIAPKDKDPKNAVIEMSVSIAGVFRVTEALSKETVQRLVKINIPVILLPHVRAAIATIFASSGFGTVTVPLFNVAKMAEDKFKDVEIIEEE